MSGIQFDLTTDLTLGINLAAGTQISASSKVLYTSAPRSRVVRCLIVGRNRTTLSDGELTRIFLTTSSNASPGVARVTFSSLTATGPDGTPVSLQADPIQVQIQSGPATQFIQPLGVLNAANLLPGGVSPGEIVSLFGSISSASPVVLFNGIQAPIIYSGLNQVNAIVPFGLDLSGPARLEVRQGLSSTQISVPVAPATPAIFTAGSGGTGPGAILNQDYSVNSYWNPATPGSLSWCTVRASAL